MTFDSSEIYVAIMAVVAAVGSFIYWRLGVQEERERREEAAKAAK